jgi:hypothetical protein
VSIVNRREALGVKDTRSDWQETAARIETLRHCLQLVGLCASLLLGVCCLMAVLQSRA